MSDATGLGSDSTSTSRARRILLVEDDQSLAGLIVATLKRAKFDATWVANGRDAVRYLADEFSLVILDLMLPGLHGLDVLKHFRSRSDVPILVLSARNESADKIRALKCGADDFVTKPFWPEELLERIHARLRRPTLMRGARIQIGSLTVDLAARSVTVNDRRIELTKVEFDLLATLAKRPEDAISRAALEDAALGLERTRSDRALDVHMSRLRKKLGTAGKCIATVWGVGYRLEGRHAL
jgi:two-component system response regulator MtrA